MSPKIKLEKETEKKKRKSEENEEMRRKKAMAALLLFMLTFGYSFWYSDARGELYLRPWRRKVVPSEILVTKNIFFGL